MKKGDAIAKLIAVMRRKHMAYKTERNYAGWARRYIDYISKHCRSGEPAQKLERFLTELAKSDCAASTQNQAFNAIVFLYEDVLDVRLGDVRALRARRPQRRRHSPTEAQVAALLERVRDRNGYPTRLIAHLLYGCGLRVSEPLKLRIKDIDLDAGTLQIRDGKGGKDRVVCNLPQALRRRIEAQMHSARGIHERDREAGVPVQMPDGLARKYPAAQYAWGWAFLFPSHRTCRHPRQGHICRYHMHEANVQRAVREAAAAIGLEGVLTPHHLRHGYGTHLLNRGANPRDIQEAMGHKSLETTMLYCHPEAARVPSPLIYLAAESA